MVSLSLGRMGRVALDLLYPPRCSVCGRHGEFVCARCLEGLPIAGGARCAVCWLPLSAGDCLICDEHPLLLERLRSAYRYELGVRRIVRAFKFSGQSSLAPLLGSLLAGAYEAHGLEADVVVPVPLSPARKRQRGYNQAGLLATELARARGLPSIEALTRRGNSAPQVGSQSAEQRRRNVEGVFGVSKPESVRGRSVLLVDDVATTGATLAACAKALLASGAVSVSALTLARED